MDVINAFLDWGNKNPGATSLIGTVITVIAAVIAVIAIVVTSFHASRSYKQNKDSDIEKSRPVMLATISYSSLHDATLLRVENIGATVAKNVKVAFDQSFMNAAQENNGVGYMNQAHLLAQKYDGVKGQDWWTTRAEVDFYAMRTPQQGSILTYKGAVSTRVYPPQLCSVTISYSSDYNGAKNNYEDVHILDLAALVGSPTLLVKGYEAHLVENLKKLHKEVANNNQSKISLHIGGEVVNAIDELKDALTEIKTPTKCTSQNI